MMSFDSQTFEHRKALLQLGDLLSDDDSKKIVFVEGLPKVLEEKSAWEILAHLEVQGKTTVKELTRILKAINRHDAAKKAKDLIGKLHRRKKDPECKALMLEDSLQLAEKHCKVLVEQVDYLKFAANKDGNKRIEEVASEAMECLVGQVQHKLRYASGLFRSQSESAADDCSAESSSSASSPESSPSCSPIARSHTIHSHITSKELKKAAEILKGNQPHPNPHAIHRCITDGELKKAAEKLKGSQPHPNPHAIHRNITGDELKKAAENLKGTSPHPNPHTIRRCITGGELKKAADRLKKDVSTYHDDPHVIQRRNTISGGSQPHPNPRAIHRRITGGELKKAAEKLKKSVLQKGSSSQIVPQTLNGAGMPVAKQAIRIQPSSKIQDAPNDSITFHQARDEEEDLYYTLPGDPDQEEDEDPYTSPGPLTITAQQNTTPTYKNFPSGRYMAERATNDVSSTDDYSCSTYSYTGDSGFSDSRAFLKQLPSAPYQREQGSDIGSSALYTSLITADVHTESTYYKSLNRESIPDITGMHESVATPDQSSGSKLKLGLTTSPKGISHHYTTADTDMKVHHTLKLSTLQSVSTYYECSNNIASVPFLGQVDILTCDLFGGEYYSSDHGIMLRIPAGAIPPGHIAHLEVAVALYGPFQFPDGSCPISPILWLCIQENINLRKPIDIILPHFLTSVNENEIECLGISFAKADHMQPTTDISGNKQYIFRSLEVPFIAYKEGNQNYGLMSTQHCCFLCIISSNPITPDFALKAGYFLWCIEKPSSPYDTLLFRTTFCLPTCRKALKSQYTEKDGYLIRNPKMFLFQHPGDGSEPCLSITTHEDRVCLVAANPLNKQIKASKIHFWDEKYENLSKSTIEQMHEEKTYPPGVELTLSMLESHPTKLPIRFDGSTANSSLDMEIMLPLAKPLSVPSSPTCEASARNSHPLSTSSVTGFDHGSQWIATDKPELSTLFKELLRVSFKWENIGILLEIEAHCLESVKAVENTVNTQNCLREMLKIWLKKINPPPSWSAIIDALYRLGDEQLAHNLRSKYLQ